MSRWHLSGHHMPWQHFSISAISQLLLVWCGPNIWTQFFGGHKKNFRPKLFFRTKNSFRPNFFFRTQILFGPKRFFKIFNRKLFVDPKFLWHHNLFWTQNFCWTPYLFGTWTFPVVHVTVGWEFLNEYFAFNIVGVGLVLWQYYSHDNKHLTLPNHADQTNQTKQDSV